MLSPMLRTKLQSALVLAALFTVPACRLFETAKLSKSPVPAELATAQESATSNAPSLSPRESLREAIFPGAAAKTPCDAIEAEEPFALCLLGLEFADDAEALALARRLYTEQGIVAGVAPADVVNDGDFHGEFAIEPALPVGAERKHLSSLLQSLETFDRVVADMRKRAPQASLFFPKPRLVKFFTTPAATTPSAFSHGERVAYNLRGELWDSADSSFETLMHELFHLADERRGDWSKRALGDTYASIVGRCRESGDDHCFDKYAPHETKVDGDIYYAFHPSNDESEYGAELAARFLREQRQRIDDADASTKPPFKCQAPENELVWHRFADEFFGGIDLVPDC